MSTLDHIVQVIAGSPQHVTLGLPAATAGRAALPTPPAIPRISSSCLLAGRTHPEARTNSE
jgi:hypothetical protein